jgi:CHAT domain-containing protein
MVDGMLELSHVGGMAADYREVLLVYFSSCLLGWMAGVGGGELEGFTAAMAQQAARRVLSGLWLVSDGAAPEFTRHLMAGLGKRYFNGGDKSQRHAFALSYRDAIDGLRAALRAINPKYDHSYYWGPWVLYGLG